MIEFPLSSNYLLYKKLSGLLTMLPTCSCTKETTLLAAFQLRTHRSQTPLSSSRPCIIFVTQAHSPGRIHSLRHSNPLTPQTSKHKHTQEKDSLAISCIPSRRASLKINIQFRACGNDTPFPACTLHATATSTATRLARGAHAHPTRPIWR